MIAGSPVLERSLRRRIRTELRASKALWREYKIHRKSRPRVYKAGWLLRLLAPAIALALVSQPGHRDMDALVLTSLVLYATGSALLRAAGLLRGLWASPELQVLSHLPLPDREFFALQWRKFLRSSAWILYTFAGLYSTIALIRFDSPGPAAIGFGLGVLQWLVLVGTAAGLAAWRPRWNLQGLGMAFCAGGIAVVFFRSFTMPWLTEASSKIFLALPAGWVTLAFHDGVLGKAPAALLWAAPAAAAIVVMLFARRRLADSYLVVELLTERPAAEMLLEVQAREEAQREPPAPGQAAVARADYLRSIPADNEDRIRNGAFLPVYDWSREGPLERIYMKMLSRRERIVAELMLGPRLKLSRKWKISAGLALFGILVALAVPGLPQGLLVVLAGMFGLSFFQGNWPGFQVVPSAGKFMPVYAVQPVEYREISRLFFKMTLVRVAAWLPVAVAVGAALGFRSPMVGVAAGVGISLKAAWILLSFQPVAVLGRFSSGSNDTERLTLRGCFGLILPFLILGVPGLAGTVCTFALPNYWWGIGAAAVPLSAWALWAFYGFLYNRGRIDLIRSTAAEAA